MCYSRAKCVDSRQGRVAAKTDRARLGRSPREDTPTRRPAQLRLAGLSERLGELGDEAVAAAAQVNRRERRRVEHREVQRVRLPDRQHVCPSAACPSADQRSFRSVPDLPGLESVLPEERSGTFHSWACPLGDSGSPLGSRGAVQVRKVLLSGLKTISLTGRRNGKGPPSGSPLAMSHSCTPNRALPFSVGVPPGAGRPGPPGGDQLSSATASVRPSGLMTTRPIAVSGELLGGRGYRRRGLP